MAALSSSAIVRAGHVLRKLFYHRLLDQATRFVQQLFESLLAHREPVPLPGRADSASEVIPRSRRNQMTRPRLTIAQLMTVILLVGFGFAALRNADDFWASATYTLAIISILAATS